MKKFHIFTPLLKTSYIQTAYGFALRPVRLRFLALKSDVTATVAHAYGGRGTSVWQPPHALDGARRTITRQQKSTCTKSVGILRFHASACMRVGQRPLEY